MKRLAKRTNYILILGVILLLITQNLSNVIAKKLLLAITLLLYGCYWYFFFCVIYNRKKLLRSVIPISFVVAKIFFANILLLTDIVQLLQKLSDKSFFGINNSLDAFYFTVITFATVGFGDIYPITPFARLITIIIVCSNIVLIVFFFNLFVMKMQRKDAYLLGVMISLYNLFSDMAYWVIEADKSFEGQRITWVEWVDAYYDKVEKFDEIIDETGAVLRPINMLSYSLNDLINKIDDLQRNKFLLIENENLSDVQFISLANIRSSIELIKNGHIPFVKYKNDLLKDIESLGFGIFNTVKFARFDFVDNRELRFALEGIDITDKEVRRWIVVRSFFEKLFKIKE